MSDTFDHEGDAWSSLGDPFGHFDEYPGGGGLHASPPRCKFCGSRFVYWQHTGVRWRLYEAAGTGPTPHVCQRTASLDDFDDISNA
jgi:hypothetical protein